MLLTVPCVQTGAGAAASKLPGVGQVWGRLALRRHLPHPTAVDIRRNERLIKIEAPSDCWRHWIQSLEGMSAPCTDRSTHLLPYVHFAEALEKVQQCHVQALPAPLVVPALLEVEPGPDSMCSPGWQCPDRYAQNTANYSRAYGLLLPPAAVLRRSASRAQQNSPSPGTQFCRCGLSSASAMMPPTPSSNQVFGQQSTRARTSANAGPHPLRLGCQTLYWPGPHRWSPARAE